MKIDTFFSCLQTGKHDELMAKRGLYYELVRQQERREIQDQVQAVEEAEATTIKTPPPSQA